MKNNNPSDETRDPKGTTPFDGSNVRSVGVQLAMAAGRGPATARELLDTLFENTNTDPRDKRLLSELVLGSLRYRRTLTWILGPCEFLRELAQVAGNVDVR